MIILYDVVRVQNTDYSAENFSTLFKVVLSAGPRDSNVVHYLIEYDKFLRIIFMEKGRLFIDYQSCKTKNYLNVSRYFRCLGLGHVAKSCKEKELCSRCGKEEHYGKTVSLKRTGAPSYLRKLFVLEIRPTTIVNQKNAHLLSGRIDI